ncbi:MAG: tetratricopeptide repeat protein [Phycisphaerales bacterium]|nr:MAG: tetratricopeptide repeat protein [Phycisphaerales bacterium]
MTLIERGHGGAEIEYLAGMVSSSGGHMERAAEHFERALKLDPDNAEYALNLGAVQMNLGRNSEAVATLTIARSLDPELAKAWGMLAEISRRKGERTAAIQYIARARELEPAEANWRVIEADALLMRDPERSIELLSGLSGPDLRRPDVLRIVKAAYGRLGRHEDAAWLYSDASDEQPDNAGLAIETAELFERAGDLDNAIFYATRAVQAGDEGARSMLMRLRDEAGR